VKVLLLGGGAREHALGWKLAQSSMLGELISTPGNPGLATLGSTIPGVDIENPAEVADLAADQAIDLVLVGPESPLAAGVADRLEAKGISCFGPRRDAARIEASKAFAKHVMERSGVPTGWAETFTDYDAAAGFLASEDGPYVVKADGLAAGKGVLVTEDLIAAQAWARLCLDGHFGEAGERVVIEEHLEGREVSVFAMCDGTTAVPLEPARDYKRLRDGDSGPNTGGMGCFSPVDDLPSGLVEDTIETVMKPVLETLSEMGTTYRGFLYAGLMLTAEGMKVLEFNCRMGDPETQVVLPRLRDDLLELISAGSSGELPDTDLTWEATAAVDVVLAAPGYPESPRRGLPITGLDALGERDDVLVFHAGTDTTDAGIVSAGGRVVNVVGLGDTVAGAREAAYEAVGEVSFEGMQFRTDIAGGRGQS
jgi:phosphoribosylamine--glycine ligase